MSGALTWITSYTWLVVVLPGQMEGSSLLETRGDSVDTMHGQDQSLPSKTDAKLLMQKLPNLQQNSDKFEIDRMLGEKKKNKKSRKRNRGHHHHEMSGMDKNINVSKDIRLHQPSLQNSSELRDFIMNKIKVFSRAKLGRNKRIEPKESWTQPSHSATLSNRELNEEIQKRNLKLILAPSSSAPHPTPRHGHSKTSSHSQVWQQQKRARSQELDELEATSLNQREKSELNFEGEPQSQGTHRVNFKLSGKPPENYDDENHKIYFPLNTNESEKRALNIAVDEMSINNSIDNTSKDLRFGSSIANTEYLEEYGDDPSSPYISKKLISHSKALNKNLASKTITIDDSFNEQTENISKTELTDANAGQSSISISSIVGIGLGAVMFLLIISVLSVSLLYKKQYMRKAESMDKSFVSCDSYSGSYADSETFNSISYADCAGIEIAKDNSSEELYNLDNDSFLNSLEAISFPEYWTDKL